MLLIIKASSKSLLEHNEVVLIIYKELHRALKVSCRKLVVMKDDYCCWANSAPGSMLLYWAAAVAAKAAGTKEWLFNWNMLLVGTCSSQTNTFTLALKSNATKTHNKSSQIRISIN